MFALPKWITDIGKLFGTADGKVLGRVDGAWQFLSSFVPSAHNQDASSINVNTANFTLNLSAADDTAQKALETLDALVAGGGSGAPVDLTSATEDYPLAVGETAFVDYVNATSVPLHVATNSGSGDYEIIVSGDLSLTPTNNAEISFSINNAGQDSSKVKLIGNIVKAGYVATIGSPSIHGMCLNESLVPILTSNITPKGISSASSEYNSSFQAWNVFDNDKASKWHPSGTTGWIQYLFLSPTLVTQYSIRGSSDITQQSPNGWTLNGSNDGINFVTLDTQVNQVSWGSDDERTFNISNSTPYLYYRFDFTGSNGSSPLGVGNIKMNGSYYLRFGSGLLCRGKIIMSALSKSIHVDSETLNSSKMLEKDSFGVMVTDTTSWTTLGTITFPFAQTGKIVIKRII